MSFKILHDVDCLDIIRIHGYFFVLTYLIFYQDMQNNPNALADLKNLISDAKNFIKIQNILRRRYERRNCYDLLEKDIKFLESIKQAGITVDKGIINFMILLGGRSITIDDDIENFIIQFKEKDQLVLSDDIVNLIMRLKIAKVAVNTYDIIDLIKQLKQKNLVMCGDVITFITYCKKSNTDINDNLIKNIMEYEKARKKSLEISLVFTALLIIPGIFAGFVRHFYLRYKKEKLLHKTSATATEETPLLTAKIPSVNDDTISSNSTQASVLDPQTSASVTTTFSNSPIKTDVPETTLLISPCDDKYSNVYSESFAMAAKDPVTSLISATTTLSTKSLEEVGNDDLTTSTSTGASHVADSSTVATLTGEDYRILIEQAKTKYMDGELINGYGVPSQKPSVLPILDSIIFSTETPKTIRKKLCQYFEKHQKNLKNPFSFERYLLEELRTKDINWANKWSYFEPNPVKLYHGEKDGFLYRKIESTNEEMEQIFVNGTPKKQLVNPRPKENIRLYAGTSGFFKGATGANGVSTATDIESTYHYTLSPDAQLHGREAYVLVIDFEQFSTHKKNKGIDVNETLVCIGEDPRMAIDGGTEVKLLTDTIPGDCIVGAYKVGAYKTDIRGAFYQNPNYLGNKPKTKVDVDRAIRNQQLNQLSTKIMFRRQEKGRRLSFEESLEKIERFIEEKAINMEWCFGAGGSGSEIKINTIRYSVPSGIEHIYDIIHSDDFSEKRKLELIYDIASKKKNQHYSLFGLGDRKPMTRYYYEKICDITGIVEIAMENTQCVSQTRAKTDNFFL